MTLLWTEPIGSIPRPLPLIEALAACAAGLVSQAEVDRLGAEAVRDTIRCFEATGSPVITDGEQRKAHNFASYCVDGLPNLSPDGFELHFVDHVRQFPRLRSGPFHYHRSAAAYLGEALGQARRPVKQAVISPSALSLMYPAEEITGYSRDAFISDLLGEHENEVRACLALGAHSVQIDFTEGRLAYKLDPTGGVLNGFIHLNNLALGRFTSSERERLGVHT